MLGKVNKGLPVHKSTYMHLCDKILHTGSLYLCSDNMYVFYCIYMITTLADAAELAAFNILSMPAISV